MVFSFTSIKIKLLVIRQIFSFRLMGILVNSPRHGSAHSVPWGPSQAYNKMQPELPQVSLSVYQTLTNTIFFFIPNGQGMVNVQPRP